jgi:hypothetical protein
MPLRQLWDIYLAQGYTGARLAIPEDALDCFYLALLAFSENDLTRAVTLTLQAARYQPANPVFAEAAVYLDRVVEQGKAGVYLDGEAFAVFIRGGGNVGLYAATSDALRRVYAEYQTLRLFDIGVGDGLALLPALTDPITRLDLIEPSAAMLAKTTAALEARGIPYHATNITLQNSIAAETPQKWDIIQATWSLQSVPPADRPAAFRWMQAHTDRLLIAEFDVPDFPLMFAPQRVRYIIERYERGLTEYAGDGGRVAQGFLMPVMFGYFDHTAARTNWEGPIAGWVADLRAAGFDTVHTHKLFAYFWADAYLIEARQTPL